MQLLAALMAAAAALLRTAGTTAGTEAAVLLAAAGIEAAVARPAADTDTHTVAASPAVDTDTHVVSLLVVLLLAVVAKSEPLEQATPTAAAVAARTRSGWWLTTWLLQRASPLPNQTKAPSSLVTLELPEVWKYFNPKQVFQGERIWPKYIVPNLL